MKNISIILIICSVFMAGCQGSGSSGKSLTPVKPVAPPVKPDNNPLGLITKVPASTGAKYVKKFDRYTFVKAPNGKPIHIFAESKITNEQILRAKSILEHYLKDYPGSGYGDDKSLVANKMADNNARLLLLNGKDDGSNDANLEGQPLYEEEIQVEGHKWYTDQDFEDHRDASFEEILHLVHDCGIGVDGINSQPGAKPEFQFKIREAQKNALSKKLWGYNSENSGSWIEELRKENSLSQEYLAAVIDSYYGLWGAWTENSSKGMWGLYISKVRDEIENEDPKGAGVAKAFFHPYLTYNARIHNGFNGIFYLKFDKAVPYTHHSQYLKDVTLTGTNNSGVKVNGFDNFITGNPGINTVVFSGAYNEYRIDNTGSEILVTDNKESRDGTNRLIDVEKLKFTDRVVETSQL